MSVPGVFSGNANNQVSPLSRLTNAQFQQLGQDLTSGNLSGAQSDFAILQQVLTQPAGASAPASGSPATSVSQQLASNLQNGDLATARQDYATIQRDLQHATAHWHHHHISGKDGAITEQDLQAIPIQLANPNVVQPTYYGNPLFSVGTFTNTIGSEVRGHGIAPKLTAPLSLFA